MAEDNAEEGDDMGKLAFGIWDSFPVYEMAASPVAADVYEQHLREGDLVLVVLSCQLLI